MFPNTQPTILLVDDDVDNLFVLSELLEPNYNILTAKDGQTALRMLQDDPQRERIQLIISDHRMPGLTGAAFLNQTLNLLPHTKQILLTGYTDVDAIIDLVNEGRLYRFITKPYDLNDMQTTVKRALEAYAIEAHNRHLIEELRSLNAQLEHKVEERTKEAQSTLKELEHALEELRQLNASKDKFFSIVAHDLRNTLQAFVLSSETLVTYIDVFDRTKISELAQNMNKMAGNLHNLLENLLQWGKIQKGQLQLHLRTYPLEPIVRHTIHLFIENALHKQITITTDIPPHLNVYADKNILKVVLRNLLSNALKFTHSGGAVTLGATEESSGVRIFVQDNGIGIEQEHIQDILSLERQFIREGTGLETGTGLGLPLCQELLQSAQSSLLITSAPDQGTHASFLLPSEQR